MAAIGSVTSLLGTGVAAAGADRQAKSRAAALEYQQKQSIILAEDSRKRAAQKEQAQRRETSQLEGRQRALMGGSNLDLTTGSPLDILADTAQLGELDARVIRADGEREAAGHFANADLQGMAADSARSAGKLEVAGIVLGGVSSIAQKWGSFGGTPNSHDPWNGLRTA